MRAEKGADFLEKQFLTNGLLADKTPEEIWEIDPEKINQIYHFACDLYDEKRYEDAADVFLLLSSISPDRIAFWTGLGYASQQIKDYGAAAIAYEFAIALEPKEAGLYPYFLRTLCEMGHKEHALAVLNELMEQNFDDPPEQLKEIRKQAESIVRESVEVV